MLLDRANEQPPFVVVGHGLGAAFARVFSSRFGADVPGLVLADRPVPARPSEPGDLMDYPAALPWLARTGIMRLSGMLRPLTEGIPNPSGGALAAFLWRPDHLSRAAEELERWSDIVQAADGAHLSDRTRVTVVDVLGRDRVGFVTSDPQEARVVSAILEAVRQVRERTPKPASVRPAGR